ncbi:MAG: cardiolipin synthase B [Gammaproteobacteria bacterium]|nr:cardiolipin synthase B [Gammaproteobacteria bacterium]
MLAAIRSAVESVRLESYIFATDEIGWQFAEALAEKARQGVDVRVQIDAAGSFLQSTRSVDRYLREKGVQLRWFHRWRWRNPLRYNRRNHHKILVVDETSAYLGGFNIHRQSSRRLYGDKRWRDTHVGMRGDLARQATQLFDAFWHGQRRWQWQPSAPSGAVLVANRSFDCHHRLYCWFAERFRTAHHSIDVTTPYLAPSLRWQRALMGAAGRGVDVRLLVPSHGDVALAEWAAHAVFAPLLRAGVRIYEYLPRVLHAKTAVIDGEWSTVGTANMDYRSCFTNYEVNLVARDPVLATALTQQFLVDLTEAAPVELQRWLRRGWHRRLRENIGWQMRRWL